MSPLDRANFISSLFSRGLTADLRATLGLDAMSWLAINVPVAAIGDWPHDHLPEKIDAVAGRLVARDQAGMQEMERRASWHFPRDDQAHVRRRLATDMALSRRLLVADTRDLAAVQFCLPCGDPEPGALGDALADLAFEKVVVVVGEEARTGLTERGTAVVKARVEQQEDGPVLRIAGPCAISSRRATVVASKQLRRWMSKLLRNVKLPRHLPCVLDLAAGDGKA